MTTEAAVGHVMVDFVVTILKSVSLSNTVPVAVLGAEGGNTFKRGLGSPQSLSYCSKRFLNTLRFNVLCFIFIAYYLVCLQRTFM